MYILNDLAIEMHRAQSAERRLGTGSFSRTDPSLRRRHAWWGRHGRQHRADRRPSQPPAKAAASAQPAGNS